MTKYRGFISHGHRDARRAAKKLHAALESYRSPRELRAAGDRKGALGKFFLDDDELAASESLSASLKAALDDSAILIVVASRAAAVSNHVNDEIVHFQRNHADRPILVVISNGEPNASDPLNECFPPALRGREAPLAADLTKEGFSKVLTRVVAGIRGIDFDALWKRERRRRTRRRATTTCAAAVLCVAVFALAIETQRRFDARELAARSVQKSSEGWQGAWRPEFFSSAFRTGLASLALQGASFAWRQVEESCDLRTHPSEACVLRLSGFGLPSELIFGKTPARDQDNIRADIEDADPFQRRMLTASESIRSVSFAGNGSRIGLLSNQGSLVVLASKDRREIARIRLGPSSGDAMALSHDGSACLAATNQGVVAVELATGVVTVPASLASLTPSEIAATTDGWLVFAAPSTLIAFDRALREQWRRTTVATDVYVTRSLAEGARQYGIFESEGDSGRIELVDGNGQSSRFVLDPRLGDGVGQVKAFAISADGELAALGGNGSGAGSRAGGQVVSLRDGHEVSRLIGHQAEIYVTAFVPQKRVVLTGSSDFSVRFWDANDGAERLRLIGHVAPVQDLAVAPDGRSFVSASWDGTARLWTIPPSWETALDHAATVCATPRGKGYPSTELTSTERQGSPAFVGRPWNVCAWRGLDSFEGWRQAATLLAVRWLGVRSLDYLPGRD